MLANASTKFGEVLAPASRLRNDSNYEALLIAHEFRHETISPAFADLSSHVASAAESTLPVPAGRSARILGGDSLDRER